ncbi:MAG: AraC family transcriptional regulator [Lactobacillus sp.]|nr:MAG: AraC family transcriptional regulator [Lactobacillus sp.]
MDFFVFKTDQIINFSVGGYFSAESGWKHNSRYHYGDYELIICVKGPIFLSIADKTVTLKDNDALVIPPFVTMKGYKSSSNPIGFYWLHFILPKNLKTFKNTTLPQLPVISDAHTDSIILPSQLHLESIDRLMVLIHQLLTVNRQTAYSQQEVDYLISLIITKLSSELIEPLDDDKNIAIINYLKEWIRVNIYRPLTLDEIANEAHLNPQYLSRLFKKIVGISPKHYIIQLKLDTARALLLRSNLSIKEVADNSYFQNEKLFMRQFKKSCGVTPSQFRNNYKRIYNNNEVISPLIPIPEKVTNKLNDVVDIQNSSNRHSK